MTDDCKLIDCILNRISADKSAAAQILTWGIPALIIVAVFLWKKLGNKKVWFNFINNTLYLCIANSNASSIKRRLLDSVFIKMKKISNNIK